jgi:predicted Fe-S protein YdhL (DUF1289 family)
MGVFFAESAPSVKHLQRKSHKPGFRQSGMVKVCPDALVMLHQKVPTPCVGICSTTFGDTVCRGCKRYLHEIIDWNRYTDDQKRLIWSRLDSLPAQVLPQYFRIEDPVKLATGLHAHRIPHRPESPPWSQLLALLRSTARQEPDLQAFGIARRESGSSLAVLRDEVNQAILQLAQASYDKDFLRASRVAAHAATAGSVQPSADQ